MHAFRRKPLSKNKRGDLTKHTLEIVIAVAAIALLVFGVMKVYSAFVSDESENAKKTLDIIEARINVLGEEQGGKFAIQGFSGGDDWILVGWDKNEWPAPEKCAFESCLCICKFKNAWAYSSRDDVADACHDEGLCKRISTDQVKADNHFYSIKDVISYTVSYPSREEDIQWFIPLSDKLIPLAVVKNRYYEDTATSQFYEENAPGLTKRIQILIFYGEQIGN